MSEVQQSDKNIVLYDWLSFTSKKHSVDDIIHILGLNGVNWETIKGAHGYQERKYFNYISIHYNGRADMGVWCEMSGQGCRAFESLSKVSWDDLFKTISDNELKITRLDVAFDDHSGILDIKQIYQDVVNQEYISKSNYWEVHLSSKGTSCQIGAPSSKVLIRIYDKAAERGYTDNTHWIRCELQLRDDRAIQFTKLPYGIGSNFSGVVYNYLRFVEPNDMDTNKWRWPLKDYWLNFLEFLTPISIYSAPGMEYNEEKLKKQLTNYWGNAIAAGLEIWGSEGLELMIKNRKCKPNVKYDNLVKQHKLDVLCDRITRYFGDSAFM